LPLNTTTKRVLLTLFLMTPVVLITGLMVGIFVSLDRGPEMVAEPVGAGAGDTGGANALGEYFSRKAKKQMDEATVLAESGVREAEAAYEHELATQPARMVTPESLEQGFILLIDDRTDTASADLPIYLASNHSGWNAGDPDLLLSPRSDMRWQIILPRPSSPEPMQFKFTLGSWDHVEVKTDGGDVDNRLLPKIDASKLEPGEKPIIELTIEGFRVPPEPEDVELSADPYRAIEAVGQIRRLQVVGGAGGASNLVRELLVWLPRGYDESDREYAVLYLMDGQNVFEKPAWVPGEWRADEVATALIENGVVDPFIVVAVPHAEKFRGQEYVPAGFRDDVDGRADEFLDWMLREVKPRVDGAFRVRTGPESTAIGGSSFGGAIALYAATTRPDVFGKVIAESVPLVGSRDAWWEYLGSRKAFPSVVYIGMSSHEAGYHPDQTELNASYVNAAVTLGDFFKSKTDRVMVSIGEGQTHNEDAWAERLPGAIEFVFPIE